MIALNHRDHRASGGVSSAAGRADNLRLRVVSAVVLGALALAAAYAGGWLFSTLCVIASGGILWEWTRFVAQSADTRILLPGLAALLAAFLLTGAGRPVGAACAIPIGAVLAPALMAVWPHRYPGPYAAFWAAAGIFYSGIAFLGPTLLRRDAELGFVAILFLAAIVWMTDSFAYFVGRTLGGPRLWPRVSPNKTWTGAIGGSVGGVVAGVCVAYASGLGKVAIIGFIALLLSLLTQAGDLLESAVKRHFGAKDAGRLIPGHGGLMDRLDGFLVAALAALLIGILRQGTDAPAQGLLIW